MGPDDGEFQEIAWHPIEDLVRIPEHRAEVCLAALHRMICIPDTKVYVHCIAGWNRSPTVVWLYLVACGVPEREAKQFIEARAHETLYRGIRSWWTSP